MKGWIRKVNADLEDAKTFCHKLVTGKLRGTESVKGILETDVNAAEEALQKLRAIWVKEVAKNSDEGASRLDKEYQDARYAILIQTTATHITNTVYSFLFSYILRAGRTI